MNTHLREKINDGGVCDNCDLPRLAHVDGECLDDARLDDLQPRIDKWESIVAPARWAHQRERIHAKRLRNFARKGKATAAEVEAQECAADKAMIEYRAAIRRADQEA